MRNPHRRSRDEPHLSASLLDVTLQHRQQFGQFSPTLRRTVRALDAVVDVRVNQFFGQRFQATTGGNDLRENLRAVAVLFQHPLDGPELADHFADTQNGGAAFFFWMLMVFVSHTARVSGIAALVKNGLRSMGYGGICHGS